MVFCVLNHYAQVTGPGAQRNGRAEEADKQALGLLLQLERSAIGEERGGYDAAQEQGTKQRG